VCFVVSTLARVANYELPIDLRLHASKPGIKELDFSKAVQVITNHPVNHGKAIPAYSTKFSARRIILELVSSHADKNRALKRNTLAESLHQVSLWKIIRESWWRCFLAQNPVTSRLGSRRRFRW
jgi:hypothetical protein